MYKNGTPNNKLDGPGKWEKEKKYEQKVQVIL